MVSDGERRAAERLKATMLAAMREFFDSQLAAQPEPGDEPEPRAESAPSGQPDRGVQLAAAALLVELTRADHEISDDERVAVSRAIRDALGVPDNEATALVELAQREVALSVPIHEFTRLVDTRFSVERKKKLLEALWQVAYSDAELRAHEEYLVRKVADLLHLSNADLIEAKIKARERFR